MCNLYRSNAEHAEEKGLLPDPRDIAERADPHHESVLLCVLGVLGV
jgi:hypothetical protein